MNDDRLEQNRIVAQSSKVLLVLLLPALLLALLLCRLGQSTQASPVRQASYNLVRNPGFEIASPASWQCRGAVTPTCMCIWSSDFYSGAHSAEIRGTADWCTVQWLSDPFSVNIESRYVFSGWIKAINLSDKAFLTLAFYSSTSAIDPLIEYTSTQITGSSTWMEVLGSGVAPQGAQCARVHCNFTERGTARFDEIFAGPAGTPTLVISKTDAPDPVKPGERLVYTVTYSNTGNVTATHVVITETYDKNVSFFDADRDRKPGSGNRVWEVDTLGPQRSDSIVVTVTATSCVRTLMNVVEMDCDETDLISNTITTTVICPPDLEISKSAAPGPVKPGERLIYTVTYSNTGNVTATHVVITETYDENVNFFDADPDPKPGSGNRVWEVGTLGPQRSGSIVVTVTVTSSLANVRTLTNVVEMDCAENVTASYTETTVVSLIYLPIVLKVYPPPFWHHGSLPETVLSVTACPASPKDTVYAGTEGQGVYTSTTGGETWEYENGINGLAIMGLAVRSPGCQTAYAATWGGGVYERSGTSWLPKNKGLGSCLHSNGAIVIDPTNSQRLYIDIAPEACTSNYGVFVSTNGGESWSRTNLANKNVGSLFIASKAPYTIYAGTDQGVFTSTSGGAAWSELGYGLPEGKQVWAVIETPAGQVYAGTQDKGLYRLAGLQWELVPNAPQAGLVIYGLRYVKDSLYVATRGNGVYRLEDNAWHDFNNGLPQPRPMIYLMSSTEQRLYIATSNGVWWLPLP